MHDFKDLLLNDLCKCVEMSERSIAQARVEVPFYMYHTNIETTIILFNVGPIPRKFLRN